jgi:ABC-type nitrate/sulfonate/bicarbonate transport system substrate-binding protein
MKELFIAAHEELIEERMSRWCDAHPDATDAEYRAEEARAYDQTADAANDRYRDKYADMVDAARQRAKDSQ